MNTPGEEIYGKSTHVTMLKTTFSGTGYRAYDAVAYNTDLTSFV